MGQTRWLVIEQIIILIILFLLSIFAGNFFGGTSLVFIFSLLGYIFWHAAEFIKLYGWMIKGRNGPVPDGRGPWFTITEELFRWRKRYKKNRKELISVISEFRTSTEALSDAVVVLDSASNIVWSNKASTELLGINRKRDLSQRITNLIRFPKFIDYIELADFSEPLVINSPANPLKVLSLQFTPYLQGQKLLVCRDVTRLHLLEKVRRDFVTNVSHEMRTPLTVINGYLEVMDSMQKFDPETTKQIIKEMVVQGHRMKNIVDELLYLSKMELGIKTKAEEPLQMESLLAQLKQEAEALSAEQNHIIEVEVLSNKGILGSFNDIHKIFSNLVFNAVRYTPAKGKISIQWKNQGETSTFSVTDSGVGIAEEDIPRLTERFFRGDRGRDRDEGGTGLGLAIVKHTLERYQATLLIESELDQGSTFSCHFSKDWLE